MSSTIHIFFTGATGYIGGAVLTRLIAHSQAGSFKISALVRSEDKAEKLKQFGIVPVLGSHDTLDLIEKEAEAADIVIATADADHLGAARAILRGLKAHRDKTGKVPILIHTSGTGVLSDKAAGLYSYDTVYSDSDPDQIETLATSQPHRSVDVEIVAADISNPGGYVLTHIILPSTIYNIGSGPLAAAGIVNIHSQQIPNLVRTSLARGQGGMIGEGKNLWPNVDIDDVADLYIILFNALVFPSGGETPGHGREGFYFGENGEHSLYDVGRVIAELLVARGRGKSAAPTAFTKEEIDKYLDGSTNLGSNSRCRADRSRALGWKPIKTTKDMLASVEVEVDAEIAKETK